MANLFSWLHKIINELGSAECSDTIFLCKDLVPKVSELADLLDKLKNQSYISQGNVDLVAELLYYLSRYDLLEKYFNIDKEEMKKKLRISKTAIISSFRLLLYELGNLVPDSKFKEIKNIFNDELTNAKLDKANSLLDAFTELEKVGALDNLEYLKKKAEYFDDDFKNKLLEYEKNDTDEDQGDQMKLQVEDISEASEEFYDMNSEERGICLIINNFDFEKSQTGSNKLKNRRGTEKDEESLKNVFSMLGFHVEVKNDLEGNKILETVQSYSMKNYEKNDCFICCILSHGNTGLVYGTDGQGVAIRDLTFCFRSCSCPSLKRKPKLFFIQACQGQQVQQCVLKKSDACNVSHDNIVIKDDLIPNEPDFLLGMATILHCLAFRDPENGTKYIQSLCRKLDEKSHREDILSILTKVNEEVSRNCTADTMQMPQPWTTLSRKLVFS